MNKITLPIVTLIFSLSGVAGLIYQVIWVRQFGNLFGNTVHSASLITGVFLAGLGLGSYLAGLISDNLSEKNTDSTLSNLKNIYFYAYAEITIAILGLLIILFFPYLENFSATISSYTLQSDGKYVLSTSTRLIKNLFVIFLFFPITTIMGSTLTFLIRYFVSKDITHSGKIVGQLYGFNTFGAALGCLSVDFFLVKYLGIQSTVYLAVFFNLISGLWALNLAKKSITTDKEELLNFGLQDFKFKFSLPSMNHLTASMFLTGLAGMGMEIAWFRFFVTVLNGKRQMFSTLLAIILIAMWLGAFFMGRIKEKIKMDEYKFLTLNIAAVAIFTTILFIAYDSSWGLVHFNDFFNIAFVIFIPSFFMGAIFPLANSIYQKDPSTIGKKAGALYLYNTMGALCGSTLTGFILLPMLGMTQAIAILILFSIIAILVLNLENFKSRLKFTLANSVTCLGLAIFLVTAPADFLFNKSFPKDILLQNDEKIIHVSEGILENIAVVESKEGDYRSLFTNGHSMSNNSLNARRYMKGFIHFPLLQKEKPENVLIICFGVGNTASAASLYPGVEVDIVDLSEHVLNHAHYFEMWNKNVLNKDNVNVFVNDGRQHLRMTSKKYDLITLEPPPLDFAGVNSLYSKEFYSLAYKKLKKGGMITQWLPVMQLPRARVRSLVKSFVDSYDSSVLLSGSTGELVLMGSREGDVSSDYETVKKNINRTSEIYEDLKSILLHTPLDYFGSFLSNDEHLKKLTEFDEPVTDNYPLMEYSWFEYNKTIPMKLVNPKGLTSFCDNCSSNELKDFSKNLNQYLRFIFSYYRTPHITDNYYGVKRKEGMKVRFNLTNEEYENILSKSLYLESL